MPTLPPWYRVKEMQYVGLQFELWPEASLLTATSAGAGHLSSTQDRITQSGAPCPPHTSLTTRTQKVICSDGGLTNSSPLSETIHTVPFLAQDGHPTGPSLLYGHLWNYPTIGWLPKLLIRRTQWWKVHLLKCSLEVILFGPLLLLHYISVQLFDNFNY